ncbi:hypothetical protein SAMN05192562_101305 [Kosakonia arachidis]|uniref:Methylmalonyl-CoA mutase n=1 Tax=Kosakonia arachidis TaxID=551989 RepID=A0A1I6Y268_9ENTR|nr:hypothetical protein [Kosakonia arachidis]SFT44477.1 hypothetical protein SAMN05192562_101305 [Kosakonia arachidis]
MSNKLEWQKIVNKELSRKGKTIDSLIKPTPGGIAVEPLYTHEDLDERDIARSLPLFTRDRATGIPLNSGRLVFQRQENRTPFIAVILLPGKGDDGL